MIFWILFIIFISLYLYYAYRINNWLSHSLNEHLDFFYEVDPNLTENYKPFARLDRRKWNHLEMHFCALFLFPWRLLFTLIFTVQYYFVISFCEKIWGSDKEQTPLQRKIIQLSGNALARGILFCAGFYWISHKKAKISNYLPDYQPPKQPRKAPIIISNHYSWLDIYYFISSEFCPSFLSKSEVKKYPLIGKIAIALQSLFVQRDNRDEKNQILDLIRERSRNIREGKNRPAVLIFPEGTTTNGKYLISFKKGAFLTRDPLQIICLKYDERNFALSYDIIGDLYCIIFPFLQFRNKLTVTEFDVFDPEYLNLKSETEDEDEWMVYMKKVKEVMLKCLSVKDSAAGFNDKKAYHEEIKKRLEEWKQMKIHEETEKEK